MPGSKLSGEAGFAALTPHDRDLAIANAQSAADAAAAAKAPVSPPAIISPGQSAVLALAAGETDPVINAEVTALQAYLTGTIYGPYDTQNPATARVLVANGWLDEVGPDAAGTGFLFTATPQGIAAAMGLGG